MTTTITKKIVLEVVLSKDDPFLLDKVAGRAYTIDGVEDVRVVTEDREAVIEEVAEAIQRFVKAFGQDTVQSFAKFVRGLK